MPGAGTPPPALVGRDKELEAARIALARLQAKRSSQHLLLQGLRGVGKTVLLGAVSALAESSGYSAIQVEGDAQGDAVASALRDRLINDGVVFSPSYGQVSLALPLLDDYLRRTGP